MVYREFLAFHVHFYYTPFVLSINFSRTYGFFRKSYLEGVRFKGYDYGYDYEIRDEQYGLAPGVAGHFIVFDQFEFNIYYGPDYLFSGRPSQMNLSFDLRKKWQFPRVPSGFTRKANRCSLQTPPAPRREGPRRRPFPR